MSRNLKVDFEDDDILNAKAHGESGESIYVAIELKDGTMAITIEKPELLALLTLINQKEEAIKMIKMRGGK